MTEQATAAPSRRRTFFPLVLLAFSITGLGAALALLPPEWTRPLAFGLLGLFAMVGVVALFVFAAGLARLNAPVERSDFAPFDLSEDAVLAVDRQGRVLYANPAYLSLVRAPLRGEVRRVEDLFGSSEKGAAAIYRLVQGVRDGAGGSDDVLLEAGEAIAKPGWYRVRVRNAQQGGGRVHFWTLSNIHAERQRQDALFQELQDSVAFLDRAPAGFVAIDGEGRIHYANATLADWLGYDLTQFGSDGLVAREIFSAGDAEMLTGLTGAPGSQRTEVLDLDLRRRGGERIPVRLFHSVAFDANGRPEPSRTLLLNRALGQDVEEGQRVAEIRFARFFNTMPLPIAAIARDGRIVRANAAFMRLFGRVGDGDTLTSRVTERDREGLAALLRDTLERRADTASAEVWLQREPNRSARLYLAAVPEASEDDEAVLAYALETTEQRALEVQFAQAQKMQAVGELAGGVAHDFNNVLQGIIGYTDLLLVNHLPTDPSFQDIMQIKQNALRAAGLVRQLLAFSRRQTLLPQNLLYGEVLSDITMLLKRLLGERIELDIRHGRDLWSVKADLTQLEQAILNLAMNARDAMPEGGKLTIRMRNVAASDCAELGGADLPRGDYAMLEVEDTGIGMAADILEKIFQPFFTTKEVGKGTGLGLSMVYGFVRQSGGFITCRSAPGEGTVFRIFLPRSEEEAKPAATAQNPTEAKPAADLTGQGVILLVEDEDTVRAFGARALAQRGYTVHEARSGAEALLVMEEIGHVDLIVSDVVMPEMDGPTMLKELRKQGIAAKVIFVSGYAEEAFRKNLPEGEAFGFLPKPFSLKQLIETVKGHLSG
jgi:two-component system cell cycle sensor histidine kinase/response regulator CckA